MVLVSEASMLEISESLTLPALIEVLIDVSDGLSVTRDVGHSESQIREETNLGHL